MDDTLRRVQIFYFDPNQFEKPQSLSIKQFEAALERAGSNSELEEDECDARSGTQPADKLRRRALDR